MVKQVYGAYYKKSMVKQCYTKQFIFTYEYIFTFVKQYLETNILN